MSISTVQEKPDYVPGSTKVTKIERYGWEVVDVPGKFQTIAKGDLVVDQCYQRKVVEDKVGRMATAWSWVACGTIIVAQRRGRYYVVDGQHRVMAAMKRADIKKLPCIVFSSEGVQQEAKGFLDANTNRKPLSIEGKYKALLVVKDPVALAVQKRLSDIDYSVSSSVHNGRVIKCIASLLFAQKTDPEILDRLWPLIVRSCKGGPILERPLVSLVFIEKRIDKQGLSLVRKPWCDRVVALGTRGMMEATARSAAYHARGGHAVWARGVVEALNRGIRNRLNIDEQEVSR